MNCAELGWRLHKAAIDKTLNLSTREACVDAARKLHDIEKMIHRVDRIPQESLALIKLIMHQ
ncbi:MULTISPECIES: hypothetical protein [unclassified Janthinobacterium]|uniref:hypothetical protein n=1 Tax=unclassified Janthinobacterium TaxID=2610881 RepID=UPI0003464CB1|nr:MULTISPECIES: hypothetical protein [unclassified Janthinobacterium]MEC5159815.1 hypothetical protein [Janthinobacterium sp. CG_S6]